MMRSLACLTLLLVLPWRASAEELPTWSLRQLVIDAGGIVLAEPLDPAPLPLRFRILNVVSGRGLKRGDTLTLDYGKQYVRPAAVSVLPSKKKAPRIEQALLFLAPVAKGGTPPARTPITSGLRFWIEDGSVLAPMQEDDTGPYVLATWSKVRWNAILRQTRAAVAAVERVRGARRLVRLEERNRELLRWLEQHRNEFGDGRLVRGEDEPQRGWGTLERDVFQWILDAGRHDDSWRAVCLHVELNRGDMPVLRPAHFGTRAGRAFLLDKIVDEKGAVGDRARALKVLVDRATLGLSDKSTGAGQRLEPVEQNALLDRLPPLLAAKAPALRLAVVQALGTLSGGARGSPLPRSRRAVPALVKAYRAEPPGAVRNELAEVLCALAEPRQWQELTGYPAGLLVRVHDLMKERKGVVFWLSLYRGRYKVHECPTLTLERVAQNGKTEEKKNLPLPVSLPVRWSEGWDGASYLLVKLPLDGLKPGTWRIVVNGTAVRERERVKWKTDPRTFEIVAPRPGAMPGLPPEIDIKF